MQQWITNVLTKYMGDWYFRYSGNPDHFCDRISDHEMDHEYKSMDASSRNIDAWSVHSLRGIFSDEYDFVSGREVDQCAGDRGGGRISAGTAPSA